MPITLNWYNAEKTIVLERFEGHWTVEEYYRLIDEAVALLASVPHMVHILVDGSGSTLLPRNMLGGLRYAARSVPPNQGITVFVHVDTFTRALIQIGTRISTRLAGTLYVAESLPEAERILAQHAVQSLPGSDSLPSR